MTLRRLLAAAVLLPSALIAFAGGFPQESEIKIDDDDQTRTITCKSNAVTIEGDDNTIALQGECSRVTVSGDDNTVTAATVTELVVSGDDNTVAVDTVARISTTGDDNKVAWKSGAGGKSPQITNSGEDNVTSPGGN